MSLSPRSSAASDDLPASPLRRSAGSGWLWLAGWVAIFVGLVLANAECLRLPPYEDQAVGLWTEASFLAESGFDYYRLRYEEPHFMSEEPGARSYMISIVPTLLAVLMLVSPSVEATIVTAHLATFLVASWIALLLFGMLRQRAGSLPAALTTLAVVVTPAFRTQIQMVGLDIPLTLFCLLTALAVVRERYWTAAVLSSIAFLIKATGGLLTMATIVYLVGLLVLQVKPASGGRGKLWQALAVNLVALTIQTAIVLVGDESVTIFGETTWPRVFSLPYLIYWAPDLVGLFVVATVLSLSLLVVSAARTERSAERSFGRGWWTSLAQSWQDRALLWFSWIVCLGMVSSSSLLIWIPRYLTCAIPFLYLVLALILYEVLRWPRVATVGFVLLVGFQIANAQGRFLPPVAEVDPKFFRHSAQLHPRSCPFTERSLEYQIDQRSIMDAIGVLERNCSGDAVLIAIPYRFLIERPELGYVRRPLATIRAESFEQAIRGVRSALLERGDSTSRMPVCFWFGRTWATAPPPSAEDEILYDDGLTPSLLVYRMGFAGERPRTGREIEQWYLDRTWPTQWPDEVLPSRAKFLYETGRWQRALEETESLRQQRPENIIVANLHDSLKSTEMEQQLANLLERAAYEPAIDLLRTMVVQYPDQQKYRDQLEAVEVHVVTRRVTELLAQEDHQTAIALVREKLNTYPENMVLKDWAARLARWTSRQERN